MTIVENQMVEVKWSPKGKRWYEEKGYVFTGVGQKFKVKLEDLQTKVHKDISAYCDSCHKVYTLDWCVYCKNVSNKTPNLCSKCRYADITKRKAEKRLDIQTDEYVLETYNKLLSGEIKVFPDGIVRNITKNQVKILVQHLVNILIQNGIIKDEKEAPKFLTMPILRQYGLSGLAMKYGKTKFLTDGFDNKFLPWEFRMVDDGFWENEENLRKLRQGSNTLAEFDFI